jgi:hypothetical protein
MMPRTIPLYPLALVLAAVVTLFVNAGEPVTVLPRPVVVAALVVLTVQLLLSLLLRSRELGALATLVGLLMVARLWPLAAALLIAPAWWLVISWSRRRRGLERLSSRSLQVGHRALGVFSGVLLAVVVVFGALSGAFRWYGPDTTAAVDAEGSSTLPNIYLVLLDGYPSLQAVRDLGFDNESFAEELGRLGFEVSRESRSNYSQTWPTLASMFQMGYLQDEAGLLPAPPDLGEQRRRLAKVINTGRALAALRSAGYRIATMPSPFSSTALLAADRVVETGDLNEFEELLLRNSGVLNLFGDAGEAWVVSQERGWIESNIDALGVPAASGPTLTFNHIMAPHPPFLFKADGSATEPRECYPRTCPFWVTELAGTETSVAEYGDALEAELAYLNARILERLETLITQDPGGVVILFSDHGLRFDASGTDEAFENFFAARTPGRQGLFGSSASPVNLFPTLLNEYLRTDFAIAPYRAWRSGLLPLNLSPLELSPSTPTP